MKQLKDTIAQLKKENVDLKVETIIQQKIIESHADHSESESYNCENVTLNVTKKILWKPTTNYFMKMVLKSVNVLQIIKTKMTKSSPVINATLSLKERMI